MVSVEWGKNTIAMSNHASSVLRKIAIEGRLQGSSTWIRGGYNCVCFTESPISELAATLSLSKIAADDKQRPRYEPYGVAVKKEWLYNRGGRPVIYESDLEFETLDEEHKYRHVRYEPENGIDHTWEREWRIQTDKLILEPEYTLFVLPSADEAFELTYEFANIEPDSVDDAGNPEGYYHKPRWMAVSLDLFGFNPDME